MVTALRFNQHTAALCSVAAFVLVACDAGANSQAEDAAEARAPAAEDQTDGEDRRITVRAGDASTEIDLGPLLDAFEDLSERQLPELQERIETYAETDGPRLGESLSGAVSALGALGEAIASGVSENGRPYVWISPPSGPDERINVRVVSTDGQTPVDVSIDESRNGRTQTVVLTSESGQRTTITIETQP